MLQALSADLAASTKEKLADLDSKLIAEVTVNAKKKIYDESRDSLIEASRLKRCLLKGSPVSHKKAEIDSIVNLYYALEKVGIITNQEDPVDEPV
jgi:hypothetical protein